MNTALRTLVLVSGVGLAIPFLGGCRDNPRKTADILAQDSTLDLAVMSANQDTASPVERDSLAVALDSLAPAGPSVVAENPAPVAVAALPQMSASRSKPVARRSTTTRVQSSPVVRHARISRSARRSTTGSETLGATGAVPTSTASERIVSRTTVRPSGTISAGSELALVAGQRVCTYASRVGDEFTTLLTESVVGTNGTVIPRGAMAVAEISSLKKKNAGFGLRISSITFAGKTYPVISHVNYTEVERVRSKARTNARAVAAGAGAGAILGGVVGGGAGSAVLGAAGGAAAGAAVGSRGARYDGCIPERGRITAQLTEPLMI
ncbi:MAG: hypothetical protein ABI681_09440 [Gemmatimonadales bacterium]